MICANNFMLQWYLNKMWIGFFQKFGLNGISVIWSQSCYSFHVKSALKITRNHTLPMKCKARFSILICMITVSSVLGHGRMIDPPSHNSAWRFKPQNTQTTSLTVDGLTCRGKQTTAYVSIPTMRKISPYLPTEIRQRYHHQDPPRGPRNRSAHWDNVQSHGDNFFCFKISELGAAPITKEKLVYQLKEPDGSDSWELLKDTKILVARSTAVWFHEILQVS